MTTRRALIVGTGALAASLVAPGPGARGEVDRVSTDGLQLVHDYLAEIAARLSPNTGAVSRVAARDLGKGARIAYERRTDMVGQARAILTPLHGGYVSSTIALTVSDLREASGVKTFKAHETTHLRYASRRRGTPESTSYATTHDVRLAKDGGSWRIDAIAPRAGERFRPPTQWDPAPLTIAQKAALDEIESSTASPRSDSKSLVAGYNHGAMINYARSWWNSMNPAYPRDFSSSDCTNFVSQCVRAGGWQTVGDVVFPGRGSNSAWFYAWTQSLCSYSWGAVQNFRAFATGSRRCTYIPFTSMMYSDLLMYDFQTPRTDGIYDHIAMCTSTSATDWFITQHSGPRKDASLKEIFRTDAGAASAAKLSLRT